MNDLYPKYYIVYNFGYSSSNEKKHLYDMLNLLCNECSGKIAAIEKFQKKHEIVFSFNYNDVGNVFKFIKHSQKYGKLYSVVAENINKTSYTIFPYIDMRYAISQDKVLHDHVLKLQRQKYIFRL